MGSGEEDENVKRTARQTTDRRRTLGNHNKRLLELSSRRERTLQERGNLLKKWILQVCLSYTYVLNLSAVYRFAKFYAIFKNLNIQFFYIFIYWNGIYVRSNLISPHFLYLKCAFISMRRMTFYHDFRHIHKHLY